MDAMKMALMKRKMSKVNPADYMEADIEEKESEKSGLAPDVAEVGSQDVIEDDGSMDMVMDSEEDPEIEIEIKKESLKPGQQAEFEKLKNMFEEGDDKRPGFMGKAAQKIKAALDKVNKA